MTPEGRANTFEDVETRRLGRIGDVSALTLGGGGVGNVWGATTREEAVATVLEAVAGGITFIDMAPSYGDGEAERVVGEAFEGRLPAGILVSTKHRLGNPLRGEVTRLLERSLEESLARMKLERVDLFFLHGQVVPDEEAGQTEGTPRNLFVEAVRPCFEAMVASGKIGDWAITGIGEPSAVIETLEDEPGPAAVQAIANLLDSPGGMRRFEGPARPRDIIATAVRRGVGVMGIRAVQAGALTDAFDRAVDDGHPEMADYRRASAFRKLAREVGETAASLAHRYALSMEGVSTVILGVKDRAELKECLAAEERGPLDAELVARIDEAAGRG